MKNFRVTKRFFNKPAVTLNGVHYFPYEDDVKRIDDNRLAISGAEYSQHRRKWLCDSYYIDNKMAHEIFSFAIKERIIDRQPASAGYSVAA